ncbi:MAG: pilin, partial [Lysobacter sp.]
TPRCNPITVAGSATATNGQTITCALEGNPKVAAFNVVLTRQSSGSWLCSTGVDAKYKPAGCT